MNISLISIYLKTALFSPIIQYPLISQKSFFSLSKSSFSKFPNSFLSISSKSLSAQIAKCNFNKFLSSTIFFKSVDHYFLKNEKYHNFHECFSIGYLKIDTCSFKNCRSRGHSGGAIFSICPTLIINSYFYYCFADLGGAICVFSDLNLFGIKFSRCSSINGGCCAGKFGNISVNSSSVLLCTSSASGGAINYAESKKFTIDNLNCSYCTSDSHSSSVYFIGRSLSMSNSIFSFCKSLNGIGGICINDNRQGFTFDMNNCAFSKMKAKVTSTSIYLDDILQLSHSTFLISHCYFYKCSQKGLIPSIHCPKVTSSSITGCFFSSSIENEINRKFIEQTNNIFNCDDQKFNKVPKRQFFFAIHPYIMPMDYSLEFVNAIKSSILFAVYLSTFVLLIYEFILVYKKIKIKKS